MNEECETAYMSVAELFHRDDEEDGADGEGGLVLLGYNEDEDSDFDPNKADEEDVDGGLQGCGGSIVSSDEDGLQSLDEDLGIEQDEDNVESSSERRRGLVRGLRSVKDVDLLDGLPSEGEEDEEDEEDEKGELIGDLHEERRLRTSTLRSHIDAEEGVQYESDSSLSDLDYELKGRRRVKGKGALKNIIGEDDSEDDSESEYVDYRSIFLTGGVRSKNRKKTSAARVVTSTSGLDDEEAAEFEGEALIRERPTRSSRSKGGEVLLEGLEFNEDYCETDSEVEAEVENGNNEASGGAIVCAEIEDAKNEVRSLAWLIHMSAEILMALL